MFSKGNLPDEVMMLYLDTIEAGGIAYASECQRIAGDSRLITALARPSFATVSPTGNSVSPPVLVR